ncbi:MAG: RnfABCDGE type electron transport complex subunit G [Bacteroidales bacterium]|jgi:electron transport complex protein RnfG|nr:RnfABCDGE type electron transport complex subunit G [Bacteroidales bacterium]
MAVQSNLKNMVLCLTCVCFGCAAVLGGVYAVTKAPIDETNAKLLKEAVGAVLPEGGELSGAMELTVGGLPSEYYTLTADGQTVAYAVKSTTVGFGGPLTIMVGITADGVVYNTSVLSHTETPGLGAKCTSDEHFMNQWKGFDPSQKILKVKSQQGDVDAITASTITSKAYTLAVENAVNAVKSITEEVNND